MLVLGAATLGCSLAAAGFLATDEEPDLIGSDALVAGSLSVVLLVSTLIVNVRTFGRTSQRRSAALGLTFAIGAYPVTAATISTMYAVLGLLGISL